MSQAEMRRTSHNSYNAKQSMQAAGKKFKQRVEEKADQLEGAGFKKLVKYPCARIGEATHNEWLDLRDRLDDFDETLGKLARKFRKADRKYNEAWNKASEAYRRHNGLGDY